MVGELGLEEFEASADPPLEAGVDDDGDELSAEALAELEALATAESEAAAEAAARAEAESERRVTDEARLSELRSELELERAGRRVAVERYRAAALAAEPTLPPELVSGESVEELEASLDAARRAVAQIRERLAAEDVESARGFPVGSPARRGPGTADMTASEKIAYGLGEQAP